MRAYPLVHFGSIDGSRHANVGNHSAETRGRQSFHAFRARGHGNNAVSVPLQRRSHERRHRGFVLDQKNRFQQSGGLVAHHLLIGLPVSRSLLRYFVCCLKIAATVTSSGFTGRCRAKLSRSCTKSFVLCVSCKIICRSSFAAAGTPGFSSNKSVNPRMAASGLFTSCATPETSLPKVAMRSACASLACITAASVMSV